VTRATYAARRGFRVMSDRVRTAMTGSLADKADAVFALTGQCTGLDVADLRASVAAIRAAEDTLIDGQNGGTQCVGRSLSTGITSAGFTLRRVHIKNCNQAVDAARFTVIDSFHENINGDGTDQKESILGTGPGPLVVQHTTIFGEANEDSGPWNPDDGGVSAAVAFYVHGSFWPDINGITFEQNYLRGNPGGDRQAVEGHLQVAADFADRRHKTIG
jgi:hypothetical protein